MRSKKEKRNAKRKRKKTAIEISLQRQSKIEKEVGKNPLSYLSTHDNA